MNITHVHLDKGRAEAGASLHTATGNSRDAFANQSIQFISRFHHVYSELWPHMLMQKPYTSPFE